MREGDTTEWGLTLAPALLEAASAVAGVRVARATPALLGAIATGAIRRAWPSARVAALTVEALGHVKEEETAWVRATVSVVDTLRARATLDLAWTNQRGEGVARGTAVVELAP